MGHREGWVQAWASWIAAAATIVAGEAALADRRRVRRADADRVGWVPWPAILMLAILVAAVAAAVALGR